MKDVSRCYYDGGTNYDLEALDGGWLTGCPLCGGTCWALPREEIDKIDAELDAELDGTNT